MWLTAYVTTGIKIIAPLLYVIGFLYVVETYKEIEREKINSNEMIESYKKTGAWG